MKYWLVGAVVVMPLAACSDDIPADLAVETVEEQSPPETEAPETAQSSVAATASLAAPTVTEVETTAVPTTAPPTTVAPVDEPLAVWEGDTPLTDFDDQPVRLKVELLELSRADEMVTLRWALTRVGGEQTWAPNLAFGEPYGGVGNLDSTRGITLLDLVNGNRHLTSLDDAGDCLCTENFTEVEPDQRVELYAQFAAPPPSVTEVSVVIPSIPPFESVPIAEGG